MKRSIIIISVCLLTITPVCRLQAQIPIVQIIKVAVKKALQAADLKIQRLQNTTVALQNAQKLIENKLSQLKLSEISDWANKQKELYAKYFDELYKVKNVISTYQAVKDIINRQVMLVQEYSKAINLSRQDRNFTVDELSYMQRVYEGILAESLKNIEQVQLVINAFATQMTDAKRLEIIHRSANSIEQNITDLRQFNQQNIKISLQRSKEKNDIDVVKKLYGIAE